MKILLVTEFFPGLQSPVFSGGVETRIFYTAKNLANTHTVIVLSRRRFGESSHENEGNLEVYRLGSEVTSEVASLASFLQRLVFIFRLTIKGLSCRVDVVEGSNAVVFLAAFFIGMIKGIPKIAWYPDLLGNQWQRQFGIVLGTIGFFTERLYLFLPWDKIITISSSAKQKFIEVGMAEEKILVIPCGVDGDLIKRIGSVNKARQLIVVSRLVKYKRVDWAIKVFAKIQKKLVDYRLLIVGKGPQEKRLKQLVDDLGINNQVVFKHSQSEMEHYREIASSEVLLHPSLVEGFGIVLVEAAALGTPFLAANIPTSLELIDSLNSGLTFRASSQRAMFKKTYQLLTDEALSKKHIKSGLNNYQQFDWKSLTGNYEAVLRQIVKSFNKSYY